MREWQGKIVERYFYDDGLLFLAYVWAGGFFVGSLIKGDINWYLGMVWFAQNLSVSLSYLKWKDKNRG